MSEILPLAFFMALVVVVFYIMIVTHPDSSSDESDDRANPLPTRWRRHLEKPPHLAFRPTRFDRHPAQFPAGTSDVEPFRPSSTVDAIQRRTR